MKHICPAALAALVAAGTFAVTVRPPAPELKDFRAPVAVPQEHVKGFLWLEAEGFADYGDWRLDTQFTHKMGSAYLLAVGVLKPIDAARTTVRIPTAGTWRVWARTKDWLPEHSPGTFTISVGGTRGATLGASKKDGWRWERAGDFALAAGETDVALVDLSGAFGRCDALLFTSDLSYVPPDEGAALDAARVRFADGRAGARPSRCDDGGMSDVVVVGSGTAGMGAALAAARTGARVTLVHDRPILGGNSSSELGIGTDGAAGSHPNKKLNMRETGLCEEANLMRGRTKEHSLSSAYALMAGALPNLTVVNNTRVLSVEKDGDAIASVIGRDTLTGRRTRYRAKLFVDCTGDGWVGYFADAAYMYGREAQSEYNEWPAPEKRDDLTMSGCLMDVPYETPPWANVLPPGFTRHIRSVAPSWWIEHGGRFDDTADPERARDELVRISFAYWGWLKNDSHLKDEPATRCAEITFVPYMNGRREGMRLTGDYVLTANDALEGKMFPDRITYGGWPLDTHDPLGMENPNEPERQRLLEAPPRRADLHDPVPLPLLEERPEPHVRGPLPERDAHRARKRARGGDALHARTGRRHGGGARRAEGALPARLRREKHRGAAATPPEGRPVHPRPEERGSARPRARREGVGNERQDLRLLRQGRSQPASRPEHEA